MQIILKAELQGLTAYLLSSFCFYPPSLKSLFFPLHNECIATLSKCLRLKINDCMQIMQQFRQNAVFVMKSFSII